MTTDPLRLAATSSASGVARLRWHVLALAVSLTCLLIWINTGEIGFTDEGVYSAQAALLDQGSWSAKIPAPEVDPTGERAAITGSTVTDGRFTPYARHPLYPLILAPAFGLGGFGAMLALSTTGTILAALFGALIARRIDEDLAVPTLWLIGLGSPLLFDAYLLVAHSLAAAAAGALVLVVLRTFDEEPPRWLPLAAFPISMGLTMLRSEGALVSLSLAGTLAALAVGRRGIRWSRALLAGSIGMAAVCGYFLDSSLADRISGIADSGSGSFDREPDAFSSAWVSLIRPWHGDATAARASTILMLVCVVLAAIAYRTPGRYRFAGTALLILAAGCSVIRMVERPELISGLFATFPLLILGIAGLSRANLRRPAVQLLAAVPALSAGVLLLTIYKEGGATEWGGRFFHVLIPMLAPLAVLGTKRLLAERSPGEARVAFGAVLAITAALSITAVRANVEYRTAVAATLDTVAAVSSTLDEDNPLVIVSTMRPTGSARAFWRDATSGKPVVSTLGMGDLHGTLRAAKESGRREVVVVTPVEPQMLMLLVGETLDDLGWTVLDSEQAPRSSMKAIVIGHS